MTAALLSFLAGFGSEALSTLWVGAVERKRPWSSAVYAAAWALLALLGLDRALREFWAAVAWVGGYGAGSLVVVLWLRRNLQEETSIAEPERRPQCSCPRYGGSVDRCTGLADPRCRGGNCTVCCMRYCGEGACRTPVGEPGKPAARVTAG